MRQLHLRRGMRPGFGFGSRSNSFRSLRLELLEPRCCLAPMVPAFSSLPSANHTIHLDFDGHVTQGTPWNKLWKKTTIHSPAYDIDNNSSTYSAQELANIENAWKRVAEDFAPFQVNVTTVDPGVEALRKSGASDARWGIRVVITADTERTRAGGIGYVGSFNWNSGAPVFVYTRGEKSIAEAASHEVGHSLGLAHDGTTSQEYYGGHGSGETSWAPLMGVGYSANVTTWSRGEYRRASNSGGSANYGRGPDDLAIITTVNGFGYRLDDFGNSLASASALQGSAGNVSTVGIIETTSDVDVLRFQAGAGSATLSVRPFTPGPNLDVKAELLGSQGAVLAVADPAASLSATVSATLTAGTYYLRVSGVGTGNPLGNNPTGYTDYASLGRYVVTGSYIAGLGGSFPTLPSPPPPPGGIHPFLAPSASGGATTGQPAAVLESWSQSGLPLLPVADPLDWFGEGPDSDYPLDDSFLLLSTEARWTSSSAAPLLFGSSSLEDRSDHKGLLAIADLTPSLVDHAPPYMLVASDLSMVSRQAPTAAEVDDLFAGLREQDPHPWSLKAGRLARARLG